MENLGIDPKLMLAQIVNFVLFFIIVKKFIAKPFIQFIANEKKKEKDKERILEEVKKSEEECLAKEQELKLRTKKVMTDALDEAKKETTTFKSEMMRQAEKEVSEMKVRAQKQLTDEREELHTQMKDQTLNLSVSIVTEALKESLDEESKRKVTKHILSNMPSQIAVKN